MTRLASPRFGEQHLRVTPTVWVGFATVVGYLALVIALQAASGIGYTEAGDSAHNLFFGTDVSLIVGTVALVVLVSALGWWRPVLVETPRSRYRWPIIGPALMAVIAIVGLATADWGSLRGAFIGAALVLLLVGFTEEVVARGVLLVGLRSRFGEVWVWLISSAVFGLMHASNILLGQDVAPTTLQIASAFFAGSLLYVVRRTTGSLVPAMALHSLWDFAQFVGGVNTDSPVAYFAQAFFIPAGLLGAVGAVVVARDARRPAVTASTAAHAGRAAA